MALSPVNDRIFYACQAVYTRDRYATSSGGNDAISTTGLEFLKGVQSIGVTKNTPRSDLIDIGRFQQEFGYYGITEFEITISRILHQTGDFFYNTSSRSSYEDAHILNDTYGIGYSGMTNKLKNYDILLLYTQDSRDFVESGASGSSDADSASAVIYRCCLLKNISYNISVDGSITEDLTFTTGIYDKVSKNRLNQFPVNVVDNQKTLARQDVLRTSCVFPLEVKRMFDVSGITDPAISPTIGLQSINIDIEINYGELPDMGKWPGSTVETPTGSSTTFDLDDRALQNKFRFVDSVNVSSTFNGVVKDKYELSQDQYNATDTFNTVADGDEEPAQQIDIYKSNREIKIIMQADDSNFYQWHLGAKNFLTSMDFSGGDAGGGNVEGSVGFQNNHAEIFLVKNSTIRNFSPSSGNIY